jgi:uncharacterized protein (DUF58 family)
VTSLLRRIKTTISIHAHRKVRGLLEGEYFSSFHGRSLEFDDIRPYVPGDEVRDIDWRATARLGSPMIKRFIAARKHTLLLIVDTGRAMAAVAEHGESKRDIGILAAGTLAYIASRHGDRVALVAGNADHTDFVGPGSTEAHLERILQRIHSATTTASPPSNLARQLLYASTTFRRRMIVLVISDDRELGETERRLLRRLGVQHEVLWLTIADADLMRHDWIERSMHDVEHAAALPGILRADKRLRAEYASSVRTRVESTTEVFDKLAISSGRVSASDDVVNGLFRLLEVHRHARR